MTHRLLQSLMVAPGWMWTGLWHTRGPRTQFTAAVTNLGTATKCRTRVELQDFRRSPKWSRVFTETNWTLEVRIGRGGARTRTSLTGHRILSPVRLPIPPLG